MGRLVSTSHEIDSAGGKRASSIVHVVGMNEESELKPEVEDGENEAAVFFSSNWWVSERSVWW